MEARAGEAIKKISTVSSNKAAIDAYEKKMEGTLKRPTAENIAGYGLALCHLKAIFSSSGEDDFRDTFIAKTNEGLLKVTNAKKIGQFFSDEK
ncbi:hypothetical protein DPMN_023192 [Dreissena polymorpha]|uniref:Uncharacterized protein n=1 Tax=Dreissena polymorpha TaxID=45954 RepID=A0A9D4RB58_DREPO|nr:hypothetical protein DPMN_023192 [Dreissena polymorpha]